MSELALDPSLVALMEIHCLHYRRMYGHLRTDKMEWDKPIPFPYRQMPSFFQIKISTDKNLKIWLQMEKTLFEHYEVPLHFQTYMGIQPRQMGKGAARNHMLDGILGSLSSPIRAEVDETGLPIRSDLTLDWGLGRRYRPSLHPYGGHADPQPHRGRVSLGDLSLPSLLARSGLDAFVNLFLPSAPEGSPRRRMFEDRDFGRMRMVDDDIPPEAEHTTDYHVPRGWKRIPKKIPNSARPSPLLLALIKRSA